MTSTRSIGLVCAVLGRSTAHADVSAGDETIVIEGTAPDSRARDRNRALDDAPFVTVLHPDEHPANASVAEALATSAGATVRSLGGLGAFSSISVRGASPGHTAVLVDGVPLARLAQVTADLGRFTLASFGEVELYRGAVPIELGGAGVGGAVNLVTRLGRGEHGERVHASIGGGSYGARHAQVHYGDDHGSVLSSTTIGYQGATGDYTFFTDNGTPLNRNDDTTLTRRNNHFDQIDAATRVGAGDNERWAAGVRALWKKQGLPGSIAQPAEAADISTLDLIADGRGDLMIGGARARQLGYLLVETQSLRDPMAELGLGTQDRGYLTLAGGVSSTWKRMLGDNRGTAGVELRGERFTDANRDGSRADLVGTRAGGALAVALDLNLTPALVVTPAVRVDLSRTAPTPMTAGPDAFADQATRWDTVPSPRLTARAGIGDDLAFKTSAGWYVRLPTLLELFGDRGLIVGSPDLAPERGPTMDFGLVYAPAEAHGPFDKLFVEAVAFGSRARDTIALISTAGFVARAENVGATQSYGGEFVGSVRIAKIGSIALSYTRLVTEQHTIDPSFANKAVPRTPGHQLYARADKHFLGMDLWLDVAAQSTSFLDRANFARVPGRALYGLGLRSPLARSFALVATCENLLDTRVVELPADRPIDVPTPMALSDVAGFPLPGRSTYLTLEWTH